MTYDVLHASNEKLKEMIISKELTLPFLKPLMYVLVLILLPVRIKYQNKEHIKVTELVRL